jgi:C4-dicarboxylate transporter DctQ subunit
MGKIEKYWTLLEDTLTGVFFISGLGLIFYGVILRYVFHNPRPWVEEVTMYSVLWGILFGLSIALRNNHHIAIDLFYDKLSPGFQRIVDLIANFVGIIFCVCFVYYSSILVGSTYKTGMVSMTVGIPMWLVYLILPLSGFFFLIRFIERFIKVTRKAGTYDSSSI